jgi:hypothetical protein
MFGTTTRGTNLLKYQALWVLPKVAKALAYRGHEAYLVTMAAGLVSDLTSSMLG